MPGDMNRFHTRQWVGHSPARMFALIADIEAYPQFVPLCEDLQIVERQPAGKPADAGADAGAEAGAAKGTAKGSEIVIADMTMAYKLFRETFRSRVALDPATPEILVEYLDGPFSHLENRWQFHDGEKGGTEVEFFIAYEFRKRAVQLMVGPVFDKVVRRFIKAFEARADRIYGRVDS